MSFYIKLDEGYLSNLIFCFYDETFRDCANMNVCSNWLNRRKYKITFKKNLSDHFSSSNSQVIKFELRLTSLDDCSGTHEIVFLGAAQLDIIWLSLMLCDKVLAFLATNALGPDAQDLKAMISIFNQPIT